MTRPQAQQHIGETFEDMLILFTNGDEYVGCKFLRCSCLFKNDAGKCYDCTFEDCVIRMPEEVNDTQ